MPAASEPPSSARVLESAIGWWALAGVDLAVADAPRGWLSERPPPAMPEPREGQAPLTPASPPLAMPDELDGFLHWLQHGTDTPEAGFPGDRIMPRTMARAPLLVIIDMPTGEDMTAGRLFSGADGTLLKAMVRAIGLGDGDIGVASLLLARPASGMCDAGVWATAAARMRHYISLTAPAALLLFGDQTSRALGGADDTGAQDPSGNVNHADAMMNAMHVPAPQVLMRYPARKAAVWAELRTLAAGR
ncbi:MAG TPA: uracil-DNA glycosylase family protein [Sphingobium sp.]|nr:uracil-DNA glycosylase family protein [Sphingobium sp.]